MDTRKDLVIGCKTVATTSSIIGNACAIAGSFFMDKFPTNYFKKVHIAKSFNPVNMRNECDQVFKTCPQTLFIMPTWNPGELSYDIPRWHKSHEFIFQNRKNYYTKVLEDWDNQTFIYSIPNRIKVNMSMRIQLQTYMQAMDVQNYLSNIFDVNGYRYLNNVRMQTEMPISLIKPICLKNGWNWEDVEDRKLLNKYLHKYSYNGITEKKNLATGLPMYAFSYNTNLLLNFPEEPEREEAVKGLSQGESYVNFNFTMEFWSPNNYIFEAKHLTEKEVSPLVNTYEFGNSGNLLFNIFLDVDYVKRMKNGKHLIEMREYVPDVNVEYDTLEFDELLENNLKLVINNIKDQGYKLNDIIEVEVMCGKNLLPKEAYEIDYVNYTIKTKTPMSNTTYAVLIYVNVDTVNKIEKNMHSDEPYGRDDNHIGDIEI